MPHSLVPSVVKRRTSGASIKRKDPQRITSFIDAFFGLDIREARSLGLATSDYNVGGRLEASQKLEQRR